MMVERVTIGIEHLQLINPNGSHVSLQLHNTSK